MSNLLLTSGKNRLSPVLCTYPEDLLQLSQSVSRTGHSENTWGCWTQGLPAWEKLPASFFAVALHLGVLSWNNPRTLENKESYSPSMLWFIQGNWARPDTISIPQVRKSMSGTQLGTEAMSPLDSLQLCSLSSTGFLRGRTPRWGEQIPRIDHTLAISTSARGVSLILRPAFHVSVLFLKAEEYKDGSQRGFWTLPLLCAWEDSGHCLQLTLPAPAAPYRCPEASSLSCTSHRHLMPPSHGHFYFYTFVQEEPLLKCPHSHSWLISFFLAAGTLSILSPVWGHSGPHYSEAMFSPLDPGYSQDLLHGTSHLLGRNRTSWLLKGSYCLTCLHSTNTSVLLKQTRFHDSDTWDRPLES